MSDAVSNNIPSKTVQIYFVLTISSWQQSCSFSQTFRNFTKHTLQLTLEGAFVSNCCEQATAPLLPLPACTFTKPHGA